MNNYDQSSIPRLFQILEERHITAKQISDMTGIATSNLTSWRKGVRNPKREAVELLAECLNVSPEYLAGSDQDHNALDLKIQSEIQQLSEEQKTDVLKYIKFVKSE